MDDSLSKKPPHQNGYYSKQHPHNDTSKLTPTRGWRRIPLYATPQLFTITMGTGITALLLSSYPYPARWLTYLSIILAFFHLILLLTFLAFTLLRSILFATVFTSSLRHPTESSFYGALPVSLLSLANLIASLAAPAWGRWAAYLAWGLWLFASALAVACAVLIPLALFLPPHSPSPSPAAPSAPAPSPTRTTRPHHSSATNRSSSPRSRQRIIPKSASASLSTNANANPHTRRRRRTTPNPNPSPAPTLLTSITPAHLLPSIAAIVAANTAAPVASALLSLSATATGTGTGTGMGAPLGIGVGEQHQNQASATLTIGLVLWSIGVPSSVLFLGMYFARLVVHKGGRLPRESVVSALVTVGPLNMGSAGVVGLGVVGRGVFASGSNGSGAGEVLYTLGIVVGVGMWAWSMVWAWWALWHIVGAAFGGFQQQQQHHHHHHHHHHHRRYHHEEFAGHRRSGSRSGGGSTGDNPKPRHHVKGRGRSTGFRTGVGLPFNLTTWSAIFPLGTLGLSSSRLGTELPSAFFKVVGAAVSALVAGLLVLVAGLTVWDLVVGEKEAESVGGRDNVDEYGDGPEDGNGGRRWSGKGRRIRRRGARVFVSKAAQDWEQSRHRIYSDGDGAHCSGTGHGRLDERGGGGGAAGRNRNEMEIEMENGRHVHCELTDADAGADADAVSATAAAVAAATPMATDSAARRSRRRRQQEEEVQDDGFFSFNARPDHDRNHDQQRCDYGHREDRCCSGCGRGGDGYNNRGDEQDERDDGDRDYDGIDDEETDPEASTLRNEDSREAQFGGSASGRSGEGSGSGRSGRSGKRSGSGSDHRVYGIQRAGDDRDRLRDTERDLEAG